MDGKQKKQAKTPVKTPKDSSAQKLENMIREENTRLFQQLFCTENRPAKQSFLT